MRRLTKIVPLLLIALLAVPLYAQQNNASVSGKVTGRDGTSPAAGLTIQIDSMVTENGRLRVRERLTTKTGKNGEFSMSGLYQGRVLITVLENNQPAMVKGERVGDEIFLASGIDYRANFDLSKAPPPAAAAPAGAAPASGLSAADREAARKKLEEEAAAAGEVNKSFEAGKAAFAAKDYPAAVEGFKAAVAKSPTPVHILHANLGKALDANKQYDEAVAAYLKAIEITPSADANYKATVSNYYLNLSLVYISLGKMDEGTVAVGKAAEMNPANAGQAYYNLGATLINRNKYQEALSPLKKAIELDPKYGPAYYQLGLTMVGTGDMAGAIPVLQKCLDLGTGCPDAATAKALIDAAKSTATQTFSTPEATARAEKEKADADAKAKNNSKAGKNSKN